MVVNSVNKCCYIKTVTLTLRRVCNNNNKNNMF